MLPTFAEALPRSVIEAMSAGLCVVTTRTDGNIDLISEGETGLLFRPGDVDGLVECLRELIVNPSVRERLGEAAQLEFLREYNELAYERKWGEIIGQWK